jgi:hypothetical protein
MIILLMNCKSPKMILKEPEVSKLGLVAFGLIILDETEGNFSEISKFKHPIVSRTQFFDFNKDKNKINYQNTLLIDTKQDGDTYQVNQIEYLQKENLYLKGKFTTYYILTEPTESRNYILGSTSLKYTSARLSAIGKRLNQTNYDDIFLDLENSAKNLPIEFKQNEINYIGYFCLKEKILSDSKFLGIGEKKIGYLENAETCLDGKNIPEIKSEIYKNGEISKKNSELQFLKLFLENTTEGHWRNLILKRIGELSNK